ncbi:hypothetical protein [Butyrivibrio hungatei]|uniref:Uncharacterized protein n=1 Tax=Butyrivibrio hungatei TaxID=185008 RepID=A0A1D9P5X3_9FIRM|nr:hypothetical protein [Butyrivibrio hungatei]AOZ97892.1 hypothetical protein bhn_II093 [Butyrivibrio hungatei]
MRIPMEETINNLKLLDSKDYENVSEMISGLAKKDNSLSVEEVLSYGEKMCDNHAEAFKVLAN